MLFFEVMGLSQWLTAQEGIDHDAALTAWVAANGGFIRDGFNNHHTLTEIDPPGAEGCVSQLEVEYHLAFENGGDAQTANVELADIITLGTECDSSFGFSMVHERPE